jgi:hypothetical protein
VLQEPGVDAGQLDDLIDEGAEACRLGLEDREVGGGHGGIGQALILQRLNDRPQACQRRAQVMPDADEQVVPAAFQRCLAGPGLLQPVLRVIQCRGQR